MEPVAGEPASPTETMEIHRHRIHAGIKLCLAVIAIVVLCKPELLGQRLAVTTLPTVDAKPVAESLSQSLAVITLLFVLFHTLQHIFAKAPWSRWLFPTSLAFAFVVASYPLKNWLVDDAAITFAYSENLVRGFGLVLHPDLPPEEAYSNTLWLLMLTIPRFLGVELPTVAKIMGLASGLMAIGLTHISLERLTPSFPKNSYHRIIPAALLVSAPMIVWSNSGLEHAFQGLLLLALATAPLQKRSDTVWSQAGILAALMLLRPETPLILAAVLGAHLVFVCEQERSARQRWLAYRKQWPLLILPTTTLLGLIFFRWCYFGDLLPNPYYAKATQSNFYGVLNLLGGGWDYLFNWFTGSAALVCMPFLFIVTWRKAPLPILTAAGIIIAQLLFILYAGGDWMHCWRFIAPIIPLYALLIGYTTHLILRRLSRNSGWILTTTISIFLVLASIKQYHRFLLNPTTPFQAVATVGQTFRALAKRLSIDSPRLAHHDAGGTSYAARLKVIDLAGLGNRALAKHGKNPEFVADYILNQHRPHFVFGVDDFFAAATGFHLRPEFKRKYVELVFPDKPVMKAPLCFIRRDLLQHKDTDDIFTKEMAGVHLKRVIVKDSAAALPER